MNRQILFSSLSIVWLLAVPAFGQDFVLKLGNAAAAAGEQVEIPITLSTETAVEAVTVVFDWEASAGIGIALNADQAVKDAANFVLVHVDTNWMTMGIISLFSPLIGNDLLLGTAVIECGPGPDLTETPIVFTDGVHKVGSAPNTLENLVTLGDNTSIKRANGLVLTDGSFRCGMEQNYRLELGSAEARFEGEVEIPLTLSTDAVVRGVTAVFDWEASAGTGVALNVVPEIDERAEFILSHIEDNWMTVGITTVLSPLTGNDILLGHAVIKCGSGPNFIDTPVVFADGVHSIGTLLFNSVTVGVDSRRKDDGLVLANGSFRCTGVEICDDQNDNDGDGMVDCEDPDCGPEIDVSPLSQNFDEVAVGDSSALPVAISNVGPCVLDVSSITLAPEMSADFSITDPASVMIAPGESHAVSVNFTPSTVGAAVGVLRVVSDDEDEPTIDVSLSGTGVAAGVPQLAADCNQDGSRNVSDVVCMVKVAFRGFFLPDRSLQAAPCAEVEGTTQILDLNGDSIVNGSDVFFLAAFLFQGGAPPVQGLECFGVPEQAGCGKNTSCPP